LATFLTFQIEELGEQGKIEESTELSKEVDRLKEEQEQAKLVSCWTMNQPLTEH
jgi:hypothetical protein